MVDAFVKSQQNCHCEQSEAIRGGNRISVTSLKKIFSLCALWLIFDKTF